MRNSQASDEIRRRKWTVIWVPLALVVLCAVFPPVRFHRYRADQMTVAADISSSATPEAAKRFWDERLLPAARRSADAKAVIDALGANVPTAEQQYGRTPAIGGPSFFFVTGTGRIVSKTSDQIAISLGEDSHQDIVMATGPPFGNSIRDGSGLLNAAEYPNSGDFNTLSRELNNLVKTQVLPTLREQGKVGSPIHFGGVGEVPDGETHPLPLQLVPIFVELK
jgi:predicted lipoprotein